jgi:hypothetical protein
MILIIGVADVGLIAQTHLLLSGEFEFLCRELSRAGGTKGRTTPETMQDMATARAARLSGRGRWAEKCRIEGRASCAATMVAMVIIGKLE